MLQKLAGLVFPGTCPGCGRRAEPVCRPCAATMVAAPAVPPPSGLDAWAAAFSYSGVTRELIARLKYRNARAGLPRLADATAAAAATLDLVDAVVTWVPTTPARRHHRGFDHAELLARAVGSRLGLPVHGLLRRRPGPPQTGQDRAQRRRGPGFVARPGPAASVLLVDDVSTTGATLAAAAVALRGKGARNVRAVTIARTPDRRSL